MRRSNILLLLLLCLLIAFAIFMIFRLEGANLREREPEQTPTATPSPTATPTPSPTPSPTAVPAAPSSEPAATVSPTNTPAPTAAPTASPTPTPAYEMSGTFRSDTGTWINLVVHWKIVTVDGQRKLELTACSESYSLITYKRLNDVEFIVDGAVAYDSSGPIELDSMNTLVETELGSAVMNVTSGRDASVRVKWHFYGEYGNRQIDVITAEAAIPIP